MVYRRSDSPIWYVKITSGGRTIRKSTGTADRRQAEKIEREWRRPVSGHLFESVMSEYLAARPTERAAYAIKALSPYFAGRSIESITAADIAHYKRSRAASPGTQKKELGVMRAAIRYCQHHLGWSLPNPTAGRMPAPPPPRLRWLTREEYNSLLQAAHSEPKAPYLPAFIILAVHTGLRRGELLRLSWQQIDMDTRVIYLDPQQQKSKRYSTVPINDTAAAAIESLGPELFPIASVKRSFRTACRRAGLEGIRIHDLRHTCAAWLVQAGVPIRTVAEIMRHTDIKTTMLYAHLSPDNARAGVAAIG